MKRIFLLLITLVFLISGCGSTKETASVQTSIPFLTYYSDANNQVVAKLSYWDLKNSKIDFTETVVYTAVPTVHNNFVEPVVWDGGKQMVLHKTSRSDDAYKEKAVVIEQYTMNSIYGRNIEAKRNIDNNGNVVDYTLYLHGDKGITEKKAAFLYKTKDEKNNEVIVGQGDVPSYVDYDSKTGEILFIFKYFFETHSSIYAARSNIKNIEQVNWTEIKLDKAIKTGGNYTPYPNNSALVGSKYYIQSYLSLAEVDLDKKQSKVLDGVAKECRSIVKEGRFEAPFPKDIIPVGVYEDILIVNIPVSSDIGVEYLMCAFRDNRFLGAIHLRSEDRWEVFDSNKKVVNEIDVKDKRLFKKFNSPFLYFPSLGNIA